MSRAYRAPRPTGLCALAVFTALMMGLAASAHAVKVAYRGNDGQWHVEEAKPKPETHGVGCNDTFVGAHLTVNTVYLDCNVSNGIGFDDPVLGATRRATLQAVIAYLDTVIGNVGGVIDIEVKESVDLLGPLANAGTYFFVAAGFNPGFTIEHVTTGVDPFAGLEDIQMTVDFVTVPWNSDLGVPTGGEADLFSVLLHELTHGLGWVTLSNSVGNSNVAANVFSRFDDFVMTGGSFQDLFIAGGVFTGNASDLQGGDGGLVFDGVNAIAAYGSRPPLYAPSPFEPGSSIAHADLGIPGTAVMEPAITFGEMKRTYSPVDIGILEDLGYTIFVPTPSPTPAPNAAGEWALYE